MPDHPPRSAPTSSGGAGAPGGRRAAGLAVVWALVPAIWVGSLWTVGYMVAPALFATLPDRALAGDVAGRLFQLEAWLGLACAALLLASLAAEQGWSSMRSRAAVVVMLMAGLTAAGEWLIGPVIAGLRESGDVAGRAFAVWHGVSAALYLAASVLGLYLLVSERRPPAG